MSLVDFSDIYRDAIRRRRDDELMASAPSGRKWLSFPDLFGSNYLDGQATGEIRWFFKNSSGQTLFSPDKTVL